MNTIEYGPLPESTQLSAGLDYYKPTMSQLAYEQEPNTEVTFSFHNRGAQRLLDCLDIDKLEGRFDQIRDNGWADAELDYLAGLRFSDERPIFSQAYLDYLRQSPLPPVDIRYNPEIDDVEIEVTGPWALSTFWETVVMSELNEAYFEGYLVKNNLDPMDVYDEGDRRLSDKIAVLRQNPDIKFADFGTRRHFSLRWQKHVMERLAAECPENLVGTSNVALANSLGVKPIGTFAHEMPMVYTALADARGQDISLAHNRFLEDWYDLYGYDYSTALTDTFTTEFFFSDFTTEQAQAWKGVRQDSGDPFKFGEQLLDFYQLNGVDPTTKTVVFSDGLDIDTIVALHDYFKGRINVVFGWGTSLTNDLGIKPLNIVMKATGVKDLLTDQEASTVKLSDTPGKHLGTKEKIRYYIRKLRILQAV